MYGSEDDLQGSSAATAGRADVYSSIDRRKENSDIQSVTYKIAGEGKRSKLLLLFWYNYGLVRQFIY